MKGKIAKPIVLVICTSLLAAATTVFTQEMPDNVDMKAEDNNAFRIELPDPNLTGDMSIEETISKRRSVRDYKDEALTLGEVSQLLWAVQGITAPEFGGRTAPSAGALYPLEVYLTVKNVEGIAAGAYRYLPEAHELSRVLEGDVGRQLASAAVEQTFIAQAPVNVVFAGVYARTTAKYGERGVRYVYMEAGHAAQNVYLQAESLGLGTVAVGAFNDQEVKRILDMPAEETPLYIMPVGKK